MTRTEDRLATFLKTAAAEIRADAMLPLAAPGPSKPGRAGRRHHTATRHVRQRRTRLAVLAATASITGIAGAVVALNSQAPSPRPVRAAAYIGGAEPNVPAFFVDAGNFAPDSRTLRVVSLATGKVTASEHMPADTSEITFLAEQAQTGNYVAAFNVRGHSETQALYRFRITGTGTITPLTRINGITLHPKTTYQTVLALSPDGSRLAVSQMPDDLLEGSTFVSKVIVLNLRTGARQVWKDRLADGAYQPYITSAVWTPDGRALVFATHMCKVSAAGPCYWQFRSLRTPAAGGMRPGPVLLRLNGMSSQIRAPSISPDGSSVVEVRNPVSPGRAISLVRVDLATGQQVVLHTWPAPGRYQAAANAGNFLLVAQQLHPGSNWVLSGWVNGAGFHALRYPADR